MGHRQVRRIGEQSAQPATQIRRAGESAADGCPSRSATAKEHILTLESENVVY